MAEIFLPNRTGTAVVLYDYLVELFSEKVFALFGVLRACLQTRATDVVASSWQW